jgi:hypothetical protein
MSTVVAVEYLSLDGVMEEPGWSAPYFNGEVEHFQYVNLVESEALLLAGSRTRDSRRPGRTCPMSGVSTTA